jgi:hypothetical protein
MICINISLFKKLDDLKKNFLILFSNKKILVFFDNLLLRKQELLEQEKEEIKIKEMKKKTL